MKKSAQALSCFTLDSFELKATGSGDLDGKTFVLKNCFSVEGHTSSFGHASWRTTHAKAHQTAPAVKKLLQSGADMIGLTKLDQLAYSLVGNASPDELFAFRKAVVQLTAPAGLAGVPEVVIPIKNSSSGLIYGIGLLGAKNDDELLLQATVAISN